MSRGRTMAELFEGEPGQWGLRGDPSLWGEMREHFSATPLPESFAEVERLFAEAFRLLTGNDLSHPRQFFVSRFARGGMSSGRVDPEFWRGKVLPLLASRYSEA